RELGLGVGNKRRGDGQGDRGSENEACRFHGLLPCIDFVDAPTLRSIGSRSCDVLHRSAVST
ncbi:MAG TPA: hypothetical protein VF386_03425, partial [Usitatibacter sp.]